MKKLFTSFILFILVLGFVNIGLCKNQTEKIQYNGFEWGMKKQEALKMVKEKGHNIKSELTNSLMYNGIIYDYMVLVVLKFTPKSKQLYMVKIIRGDDNKSFYRYLIKTFDKKYKRVEKENIKYVWQQSNTTLYVNNIKKQNSKTGSSRTQCFYGSNKFFKLYEKETEDKL